MTIYLVIPCQDYRSKACQAATASSRSPPTYRLELTDAGIDFPPLYVAG